jgi:hypothetical protein
MEPGWQKYMDWYMGKLNNFKLNLDKIYPDMDSIQKDNTAPCFGSRPLLLWIRALGPI